MRTGRWVAALAAIMLSGVAGAATVQRLELGEMAARSELIFVGVVEAQEQQLERAPIRVWTTTTFRLEDVLKGDKSLRTVQLKQLGGEVGAGAEAIGQRVPGQAQN